MVCLTMNPSFFIQHIRSDELRKRLSGLLFLHEILKENREPVTNRRRVSKKYQHIVEDYHKVIDELNAAKEIQALSIELIIGLSYMVDYSTNPDRNNELFQKIEHLEKEKNFLEEEKTNTEKVLVELGKSFKKMSTIIDISTQESKGLRTLPK